jgi:hypothetical protein
MLGLMMGSVTRLYWRWLWLSLIESQVHVLVSLTVVDVSSVTASASRDCKAVIRPEIRNKERRCRYGRPVKTKRGTAQHRIRKGLRRAVVNDRSYVHCRVSPTTKNDYLVSFPGKFATRLLAFLGER